VPNRYDENHRNGQENSMSMQSEGKDAKGRNYDQVTKDGTSSAGSYGAGSTGDIGSMGGQGGNLQGGNVQRETRTDDLLTSGSDQELSGGFAPAEEAGELQTGLGGIGSLATGNAGNRQSEGESQPGGASVPESDGQRIQK
jgi:hypothetical protein